MKTSKFVLATAVFGLAALSLTSCSENEDRGPIQQEEKEYSIIDFNRLEVGDAIDVTVVQGPEFSVNVSGDRRNIDDLEIKRIDYTLRVKFDRSDRWDDRQYTTYLTITMPSLNGVSFSGAVKSDISGFSNELMDIKLSGASQLKIDGFARNLNVDLSGASKLRGFELETGITTIDASGASDAEILATEELNAKASGASDIRYRGNPRIAVSTSGASTVQAE